MYLSRFTVSALSTSSLTGKRGQKSRVLKSSVLNKPHIINVRKILNGDAVRPPLDFVRKQKRVQTHFFLHLILNCRDCQDRQLQSRDREANSSDGDAPSTPGLQNYIHHMLESPHCVFWLVLMCMRFILEAYIPVSLPA